MSGSPKNLSREELDVFKEHLTKFTWENLQSTWSPSKLSAMAVYLYNESKELPILCVHPKKRMPARNNVYKSLDPTICTLTILPPVLPIF